MGEWSAPPLPPSVVDLTSSLATLASVLPTPRAGDPAFVPSKTSCSLAVSATPLGLQSYAHALTSTLPSFQHLPSVSAPSTLSTLQDGSLCISFLSEIYSSTAALHSSTLKASFGAGRPLTATFGRLIHNSVKLCSAPAMGLLNPRHFSIHLENDSDAALVLATLLRSCGGFTLTLER